MMNHRTVLHFGLVLSLALGTAFIESTATAAEPSSAVVAKYDKDSDKTLDWNEVQTAASARCDKLNKDNDGTLDAKELGSEAGRRLKLLID